MNFRYCVIITLGQMLHLNEQTRLPLSQECFVQSLVETGTVFYGKDENVKKSLGLQRQTTDIFFYQSDSLDPAAQVS